MIKLRGLSDGDIRFLREFDSHFFGIIAFGFVFKMYYFDKFFEITAGREDKGFTFVIATKEKYIEMFGEE